MSQKAKSTQPEEAKTSKPEEAKPHRAKRDIIIGAITIAVTVAVCVLAIVYQDELMEMAHWAGYSLLGVFIVSLVTGSVFAFVAIPVPYWLLVVTLSSVLAPQWGLLAPVFVALTSSFANTLGHMPTFMIGYGGGKTYQGIARFFGARIDAKKDEGAKTGFYTRCVNWAKRHGSWAVFAMSAMFNPLHLPMTIAIGSLRYPPWKYFIFAFLGNSVKNLFLAFCGYFGLTSIFGLSTGV
jgi:membrane protein YqaA with SNARE-associated domain